MSLDSAFGMIQGVYKTILKLIEEKKVLLGISDMGCARVVLPAVDGMTTHIHSHTLSPSNSLSLFPSFPSPPLPPLLPPPPVDALRMVNHAIESSSHPTGVKIGLDNRAVDFAKVTDAPPPPADAPADAPPPAPKVDYAFPRWHTHHPLTHS